jgi:hypothetical protein
LMTSLDVPARIAGGFYGGRRNPLTGYFAFRREDAHAWTEVWNGTRWATFDATPVGLRPGSGRVSMLREYLAAVGDSLTFAWDRYVLTYGLGDQAVLAEGAIEWVRTTATAIRGQLRNGAQSVTSRNYVALMVLLIACAAGMAMLKRRRRPLFALLSSDLARRGIEVGPAMTMEEALRQLRAGHPDAAHDLEPLIALYEEERFSPHADETRVRRLRRALAELRA